MKEHQIMKELPETERPYEKCWKYGPGILSDAELLAVILRCGSKGDNALDLARRILYRKDFNGLLGLLHISMEDLVSIQGIGRVKAVQIKCITELARRIAKARAADRIRFTDASSVALYCMEDLRHEEQEKILLLMLDTKGSLLGEKFISMGTVNAAMISPREIFLTALSFRAVSIVLVHNHPSGDPSPSGEDILFTRKVTECGEMLGIKLLDHIVIGDGLAVSIREQKSIII